MTPPNFLELLTPNEIEALGKVKKAGQQHPVASLAGGMGDKGARCNTELAARLLNHSAQPWLQGQRARLLDTTDYTNASSALGEIRAYGALLEAAFNVRPAPSVPGKLVSPEFEADAHDGGVIVEVHSRQMTPKMRQALAEHEKKVAADVQGAAATVRAEGKKGTVVTSKAIDVAPLGLPEPEKVGDSVLTNAISRIAGIKDNEKQIDPAKPFILWLDLQDPGVWGFPISEEQFVPVYSEAKDGHVAAGALWYALYGKKGAPMLEMNGYDYSTTPMLHDGRFYQIMKAHGGPTLLTGVVYSLPQATVFMENPEAKNPLPKGFRTALVRLPHFRLDLSICEWEPGLVGRELKFQQQRILAIAKALQDSNPA